MDPYEKSRIIEEILDAAYHNRGPIVNLHTEYEKYKKYHWVWFDLTGQLLDEGKVYEAELLDDWAARTGLNQVVSRP